MTDLLKAMELNEVELEQAAGGNDGLSNKKIVVGKTYTTHVARGYLALRTAPVYNAKNEIGHMYNGSTVTVVSYTGGNYAWVRVGNDVVIKGDMVKNCSGKEGYTDIRYLQ